MLRTIPAALAVLLACPGCDSGQEPCNGRGSVHIHGTEMVCACNPGYTPSTAEGFDCLPTTEVCKAGAIDFDVNDDGVNETTFIPSALECQMFELVNRTRATHDAEGTPECHAPLQFDVEWSAHARNHSKRMFDRGELFHEDYPSAQNCAYGCDPACEMDMYMSGAGEDHCPPLSHHCNIMRCGITWLGIGYWPPEDGTFNTQNFR